MSIKGVIGARPGTHRVRTYTKSTRNGFVTVREHVAVNALQTAKKPPVRSQALKNYMAGKASDRAALIRAAREKALGARAYGGRFGGIK